MDKRLLDIPASVRERVVRALADALHGQIDVVFAYLHGSFATGGPFHDIDVAVFLDDPVVRATARALDLAERLSRVAGYPVDVRAVNDAPLASSFGRCKAGSSRSTTRSVWPTSWNASAAGTWILRPYCDERPAMRSCDDA